MMKATTEWMSQKYNEMNQKLFGGKLGECSFGIFTSGRGSQGGTLGRFRMQCTGVYVDRYSRRMYQRAMSGKEFVNKDNFVAICKPIIEVNGNYSATEDALLATLVHEMCHYYTYQDGWAPTRGHGSEFYAIGNTVSAKSGGLFNIQRLATAEEMQNYQLDAEVQAKNEKRIQNKKSKLYAVFLFKKNGEIQLTMTSSQKLIDTIVDYRKKYYKDSTESIKASNDPELIEMLYGIGYKKNVRTYRYWNVENKPFVKDLDKYNLEVIYNPMNESKKIKGNFKQIVEDVVTNYINKETGEDDIPITSSMNLGLESPFEEAGI